MNCEVIINSRGKWTYDPSSHSGSTRFPPNLTPGIHDFFGAEAAAATISLLGLPAATPTLAPIAVVANKVWLLFPPDKKEDPKPFNTAPDVAAAICLLEIKSNETGFVVHLGIELN